MNNISARFYICNWGCAKNTVKYPLNNDEIRFSVDTLKPLSLLNACFRVTVIA